MISEHDKLVIEFRDCRIRLEKYIWNAAIEAAIKLAVAERHNMEMEQEIRKLKK